jgi:hypothetical protein
MLFTTVAVPTEGIAFQQPQTSVHMTVNGDTKQSGVGTVYVTERCVGEGISKTLLRAFCSSLIFVDHSNGTGFSIQYPSIVIHGISRETGTYPVPCIYMILNASGNGLGARLEMQKIFVCADLAEPPLNDSANEDGDSDTQSTSDNVTEMRLVPADVGSRMCFLILKFYEFPIFSRRHLPGDRAVFFVTSGCGRRTESGF